MLRGAQRLASSLLVQLDAACSSGSSWEALQRAGISGTAAAARRLYPPTEPVRPKDADSGVERPYLVDKFLAAELLNRADRNTLARQEVIREYERFPGDTGSTEVQVALLTRKIEEMAEHMRQHRKDYSSRRGLEAMLHQRRKLLQYLRRTSFDKYAVLISRIGLKDSYGPQDRFSSRYKGTLKGRPAASSTAANSTAPSAWEGREAGRGPGPRLQRCLSDHAASNLEDQEGMCRQPLGLAGPRGHSLPPPRPLLGGWRPEGLSASCDSSDCVYCAALARLRQPGSSVECWLRQKRSRSCTDLAGLGEGERPAPTSSSGREEPCSLARVPSATTLAAVVPDAMADSLWDHALLPEVPSAVPSAGGSLDPQQGPPQFKRQRRRAQQQDAAAGGVEPRGSASQPTSSSSSSEGSSASEGSSRGGRCTSSTRSHGSSSAAAATAAEAGSLPAATAAAWHPSWQAPSVLREVASFLPPAHHHRPRPGSSCCTDIVCALEFEEHGWLLASAGVSKQVRVYSLASRLQHPDDDSYLQPLRCHRMPSKLSCLAWNPDAPGTVTVADYDGVLSQVDMESGHLVAEVDEHSGRRVWSVHHSVQRPHLCASASEDGTVRLWGGPAMHTCIGALRPSASGAPACGVRLSPFDGNLAAVACADHSAYLYDLRRADRPLLQLAAHSRAVSYVRWLSASSLVTASTDATLALWQLPGPQAAAAAPPGLAAAGEQQQAVPALLPASGGSSSAAAAVLSQPVKRFRGHQNQKNFVGLSVRPEDGLMACGSEAPAAYAYHTAWSSPLAVHTFSSRPGASTGSGSSSGSDASPSPAVDDLFCSAVCLQPAMARPVGAPPLMATALSSGEVRVLELQRSVAAAAQRRCMDG